jgi:hypothetical protein
MAPSDDNRPAASAGSPRTSASRLCPSVAGCAPPGGAHTCDRRSMASPSTSSTTYWPSRSKHCPQLSSGPVARAAVAVTPSCAYCTQTHWSSKGKSGANQSLQSTGMPSVRRPAFITHRHLLPGPRAPCCARGKQQRTGRSPSRTDCCNRTGWVARSSVGADAYRHRDRAADDSLPLDA